MGQNLDLESKSPCINFVKSLPSPLGYCYVEKIGIKISPYLWVQGRDEIELFGTRFSRIWHCIIYSKTF